MQRTIGWTISSFCRSANILSTTLANAWKAATWGRQPQAHYSVQPNGTAAMRAANGTGSILNGTSGTASMPQLARSASSAVRRIRQSLRGAISPSFVQRPANSVRCVAVEPDGRGDVYCLTVQATGYFTLANGLVVSNCADEWRYACMSRPWTAPRDEAPKVQDRWSHLFDGDEAGGNWKVL
jgi:hypothetical protein